MLACMYAEYIYRCLLGKEMHLLTSSLAVYITTRLQGNIKHRTAILADPAVWEVGAR